MAEYRKVPVVIDATQWFKNGDHPEDGTERFPPKAVTDGRETGAPTDPRYTGEFAGELFEGKVVRYFRRPDVSGETLFRHCQLTMHVHGWIDTKEGGHIVCPGDWIITGIKGERYPCKPDIFAASYEAERAPEPEGTHLPTECKRRTCAHHRDIWRHYEDEIASNSELREETRQSALAEVWVESPSIASEQEKENG